MVFGLSVFALTAVGIAAFMVATGKIDAILGAGAIFLLAAGQFGTILTLSVRAGRIEDKLSSQQAGLRAISERADQTASRLAHVEQALKNPPGGRLDEVMSEIKALRDGVRDLIQPRPVEASAFEPEVHEAMFPGPSFTAPHWDMPPTPQQTRPERPRPEARAEERHPMGANQRLDLLLEPVIELTTGSTAHYRALLDLSDDNGHVVQHADLMQKADEGGMRPDLDAHIVKQIVPVLRRLRLRNPAMRAFVPIGFSTLSDHEDTARIAAMVERDIDVAGGIVFELQHSDLGHLEASGIEGLAKLGRLGATLALADVQVSGLDLPALRQLGVRFLTFPPSAEGSLGTPAAWREFVQFARAMQFQIVIAGVENSRQASAATQSARFAYGAFFAPPRKVRADAGAPQAARRATAA